MIDFDYDRKVIVHDSENVDEIYYSYDGKEMVVRFFTSATYCYSNVSPEIFGLVVSSESVGVTLRQLVINFPDIYSYERID